MDDVKSFNLITASLWGIVFSVVMVSPRHLASCFIKSHVTNLHWFSAILIPMEDLTNSQEVIISVFNGNDCHWCNKWPRCLSSVPWMPGSGYLLFENWPWYGSEGMAFVLFWSRRRSHAKGVCFFLSSSLKRVYQNASISAPHCLAQMGKAFVSFWQGKICLTVTRSHPRSFLQVASFWAWPY